MGPILLTVPTEITALTSTLPELRTQLDGLMLRDQYRLGRRAERAAALSDSAARERALGELRGELAAAAARAAARRDSVPVISYPPSCRSARSRTRSRRPSPGTRW